MTDALPIPDDVARMATRVERNGVATEIDAICYAIDKCSNDRCQKLGLLLGTVNPYRNTARNLRLCRDVLISSEIYVPWWQVATVLALTTRVYATGGETMQTAYDDEFERLMSVSRQELPWRKAAPMYKWERQTRHKRVYV